MLPLHWLIIGWNDTAVVGFEDSLLSDREDGVRGVWIIPHVSRPHEGTHRQTGPSTRLQAQEK